MTESTVREAEAPTLAAEQLVAADRTMQQRRGRRPAGASSRLLLLLLALLAAAAAPAARAGLERVCTLSNFYEARRHSARTSCSRQLPERLRAICRGAIHIPGGANYGQPTRHKRDDAAAAELFDDGVAEVASLVGGDDGVFLDRRTASAYLHKRQADEGGGIQGIVCECCIYPCKRREMSQYCANGSAGGSRRRRLAASADVAESGNDGGAGSAPIAAAAAASASTAAADDARQSSSTGGSASSENKAA